MTDFDPYYEWLGIAPKDQPPNHYRLLGVDRFESNPKVIASAADRQMAFLRTFQIGPRSKETQKLLTEVSAAKICLLDAHQRALYDASLQATSFPTVAPSRRKRPRRNTSRYRVVLFTVQIVVGAVGGLAVGAMILEYGFGVRNPLGLRNEARIVQPLSQSRLLNDERTGGDASRISKGSETKTAEGEEGMNPPFSDTPEHAADVASPLSQDTHFPAIQGSVETDDRAEELKLRPNDMKAVPDKPAENPVAERKERGAVIVVQGMDVVPISRDQRFPAILHGGQTFAWARQPATSVDNATLTFEVKKSGVVYLTADWNRQGNPLGGWQKACASKEQLMAAGWQHLGQCPWEGDAHKPIELFRKHCAANERYQIRVNKYWPPKLYVPPSH